MAAAKKKTPAKKRTSKSRTKKGKSNNFSKYLIPLATACVCIFVGIGIGGLITTNHLKKDSTKSVVKTAHAPKFIQKAKPKPQPEPEIIFQADPAPVRIKTPAVSKPAWQAHAIAYENPMQKPEIAIVIDDMGVHKKYSEQVLALKAPITLAFLPYGKSTKALSQKAREQGYELLVHVPMEPLNPKVDAGPHCLKTRHSQKQVLADLDWCLNQFNGFVGINNHMGSKFTAHRSLMEKVIKDIDKRGLLFLDSRTNTKTHGFALAQKQGMPHAERHIFLDHVATPEAVAKQLKRLKASALERGFAVAIGHPKPATINALRSWIAATEKEGFSFAPISAIAQQNMPV